MTVKQILQQQMDACFANKNWFVSVNDAVQNLTDEHANYKDSDENHSIKEIAIHLTFYNELYLYRFNGKPVEQIDEPNDFTFTERSLGASSLTWSEVSERLNQSLAGWQNALSSASEEKLNEIVPSGKDPWASLVSHIIMHNAYHIGQVVTLRKQYKAWEEKLGVQ